MPRCAVCRTNLPPDFLEDTSDGLAKKCIFCIRETDSIEYYSKTEGKRMTTTKAETAKEYEIFLKEISELSSVKEIIEAVKQRSVEDSAINTQSAIEAIKKAAD